jgi:tRNA 2-thiouridine synthesizing protein E
MQTHSTERSSSIPGAQPAAVDALGFLVDARLWTEQWTRDTAELYGIAPLTERHWRVIRFLRDRFDRLGGVPAIRQVCRATSVSRGDVRSLFGGCCDAWRLAGLPDPGEEVRAHFG